MSNNSKALTEFVRYCEQHPEQRFWQALRNWSEFSFVLVTNQSPDKWMGCAQDTFHWRGKLKYEDSETPK